MIKYSTQGNCCLCAKPGQLLSPLYKPDAELPLDICPDVTNPADATSTAVAPGTKRPREEDIEEAEDEGADPEAVAKLFQASEVEGGATTSDVWLHGAAAWQRNDCTYQMAGPNGTGRKRIPVPFSEALTSFLCWPRRSNQVVAAGRAVRRGADLGAAGPSPSALPQRSVALVGPRDHSQ